MSIKQSVQRLMAWPLMAALVSIGVMLLVGWAVFLWNRWSIVPLSGVVIFLVLLSVNPVGRYFRLLVSVASIWGVLLLNNAIDFGLHFERGGFFWLKMNQVPWFAHVLMFLSIVLLAIADIYTRRELQEKEKSTPNWTENRLKKRKMDLAFIAYIASFSGVILIALVSLFGVRLWHPIPEAMLPEQRVAIDRVADFTGSGCGNDGKPIDIAVFRDTVTLARDADVYFAFALESPGQQVKVFDYAVSETEDIDPYAEPTYINGSKHKTFAISVDAHRRAKVKYVWENSHYGFDGKGLGMLGITSKSYLSAASGMVLAPQGVNIKPQEQPFNDEVKGSCETRGNKGFECKELENPSEVLFSFDWDLWANC